MSSISMMKLLMAASTIGRSKDIGYVWSLEPRSFCWTMSSPTLRIRPQSDPWSPNAWYTFRYLARLVRVLEQTRPRVTLLIFP